MAAGAHSVHPLYLDARAGSLAADLPQTEGGRPTTPLEGQAVFDHVFEADTELTGYMKLRLWVEADGADNMDLFVGVQKLNTDGKRVQFPFFSTFDDGDVALGWLRVSRRELDEEASTPHQPVYRHQKDDLLSPGQVVPVEIEIWPSGTLSAPGRPCASSSRDTTCTCTPRTHSPSGTPTRSTPAGTSCTPAPGTTRTSLSR